MLGVDEGAEIPSAALGGRDHVERHRGLARALRAVDLDDPALRDALAAESEIQVDRPRGDPLDLLDQVALVTEAHDRPVP